LDVPEEEPDELVADSLEAPQDVFEVDDAGGYEQDEEHIEEQDGTTPVAKSRLHSRHVSNALSLGSVGGRGEATVVNGSDLLSARTAVGNLDEMDQDAIGEWTGSEDIPLSDMSEDEVRSYFCSVEALLTTMICRRVLASGLTHLMRKGLAGNAFNVEHFGVIRMKSRGLDGYLISPALQIIPWLQEYQLQRKILYPTRVRKKGMSALAATVVFWALSIPGLPRHRPVLEIGHFHHFRILGLRQAICQFRDTTRL
jgi:hypothetical protein